MCDYKIKHYWDEKTAEVTVEPSWITSSGDLTDKQKRIKNIVKINFLDRYIYLAKNKPKEEIFDNYIFMYEYKTKKDPYPSRDRMVTDISICIQEKKNYMSYSAISLFLLLLIMGGYVYFSDKGTIEDNVVVKKTIQKLEPKKKKNVVKETTKVLKPRKNELDILRDKVCSKNKFNVNLPDKCWQFFVQDKCNKKTNSSYNDWLKNNNYSMDCIAVESFKKDKDFQSFIKKQKNKKDIKKFMGDEK